MSSTTSRTLALCLLLALPAYAEDGGTPAVGLHQGQPAPADGVFMTTEKALEVTARCKQAEIERTDLRQALEAEPGYSMGLTWIVLAFAVGAVAGGVVVAVAK